MSDKYNNDIFNAIILLINRRKEDATISILSANKENSDYIKNSYISQGEIYGYDQAIKIIKCKMHEYNIEGKHEWTHKNRY